MNQYLHIVKDDGMFIAKNNDIHCIIIAGIAKSDL